MDAVRTKPGPDAGKALRLGTIAAGVAALAVIAFLYRFGVISLMAVAVTLLVLFPVYLILVVSLLSVWLGLGKDATDLRPVYRDREGG